MGREAMKIGIAAFAAWSMVVFASAGADADVLTLTSPAY